MIDLVGLGALNLDVIVSSTGFSRLPGSVIRDISSHFEAGSELTATRDEIAAVIESVRRQAGVCLGGSAFNVVRTVAAATGTLALGFVGCLGAGLVDLPEGQTNFEAWFTSNKVDCRFVERVRGEIPGIAVSLMRQGDRQLLTHSGANDHLAKSLTHSGPALIDYLSRARLLHVTSVFGHDSAHALGHILKQVLQTNPGTLISFDPGHHWVHNPTPSIRDLYGFADFLFLNDREFRKLGNQVDYQSDLELAHHILREVVGRECQLFVKRPHEIAVFTRSKTVITEAYMSNPPLRDDEIEDATGAGDVFAGGILTARLIGPLDVKSSVELALALVRAKLTERGPEPTRNFRKIAGRNLAATWPPRRSGDSEPIGAPC